MFTKNYQQYFCNENKSYSPKNNFTKTNFERKIKHKKVKRSKFIGGNLYLLRQQNLRKRKGVHQYDLYTKYNKNITNNQNNYNGIGKYVIYSWKASSFNNVVLINFVVPGAISATSGGELVKSLTNGWFIKCITTAALINKDSGKLYQLRNVILDDIYKKDLTKNFGPIDWNAILEWIHDLKHKKNFNNVITKIFSLPQDIDQLNIKNNETLHGVEKLYDFLHHHKISVDNNLFNNTIPEINNFVQNKIYTQCGYHLKMSDDWWRPQPYTWILSKYQHNWYMVNVVYQQNKILFGWYTSHLTKKSIFHEHKMYISQCSNIIYCGILFNAGFTPDKRKLFVLLKTMKLIWCCMMYESSEYFDIMLQIYTKHQQKFINIFPNNVTINDVDDIEENFNKVIDNDKDKIERINEIITNHINEMILKIQSYRNLDPLFSTEMKIIFDNLNKWTIKHTSLIIDPEKYPEKYKLYNDYASSVIKTINHALKKLKKITMTNGIKNLHLDHNDDYDVVDRAFDESSDNDRADFHADIANVADEIANGVTTISTTQSLMNEDPRIIQASSSSKQSQPSSDDKIFF